LYKLRHPIVIQKYSRPVRLDGNTLDGAGEPAKRCASTPEKGHVGTTARLPFGF
jgi:hypothetical protein